MKQNLIRTKIMFKRIMKQPFIYIVAVILIVLSLIYRLIPASEKSSSIPVAILSYDTSTEAGELIESITSANSIFDFYRISSEEEMYLDIAGGRAEMGFILPDGYLDSSSSMSTLKEVRVIVTDGTPIPSLATDELYSYFFKYAAKHILKRYIESNDEYKASDADLNEIISYAMDIYDEYMRSDSIFSVEDISGGKYNEIMVSSTVELPIRKLGGFFIFTAALLGIAMFLHDNDNRLFVRMSYMEQLFMKLISIAVFMLPVAVMTYISILSANPDENPASLLLHIILYCILCLIFAFLVGIIIRKSTLLSRVLPVYLVLTMLFGGIFFDLSRYSSLMKFVSGLFLPFYF